MKLFNSHKKILLALFNINECNIYKLHRLANVVYNTTLSRVLELDNAGWVNVRKEGRQSLVSITPKGKEVVLLILKLQELGVEM